MARIRWRPILILAAGVLATPADHAEGQTVRGQVLDEETGGPVEGVLALLLDEGGTRVAGYLSNDVGRFLLKAPGPGHYTVRAERIGYETVESDPFELASGQIFGLRLQTRSTAIELEGILVEGEQQCVVRPGEGLQVARVWDEARKALTVQEWTEGEQFYRYRVVNYLRTLDPHTQRVLDESQRVRDAVAESPVRSLPPETLMRDGFIQPSADGGYVYYAPDATVLLSDIFLDTHCFRLEADAGTPELVGLGFEPVRQRDLPDIRGTLWLSYETSELDYLEYRYTWAPWEEAINVAGGRVEFERMPNGAWIIRRWRIRMPTMVRETGPLVQGRTDIRVESIREVGGEVVRTAYLDSEVISEAARDVLTGQVWDSTRHGPLSGAEVYLSGTDHVAVTDTAGSFVMEDLSEGTFTVSFSHPRLDSLHLTPAGVDVAVTPGEVSEIELAVPSPTSILESTCPETGPDDDPGILVGKVVRGDSGRPVRGATVLLRWSRYRIPDQRRAVIGEEWREVEVTSGAGGRFSVCELPVDHLIISRARYRDLQSDTVHVRAHEGRLTTLELEVKTGG